MARKAPAKPARKPAKPAAKAPTKPARKAPTPAARKPAKAAPVVKHQNKRTPKPAAKRQHRAIETASARKRPRGNQPYEVTEQHQTMVRLLVAGGIMQDRIATALNISERTLRRHYSREIKIGQTEIDAQAVGALVRAMRGNGKESVIAAKWWQQSRMGWSEKIIVEDPHAKQPMRVVVELVGPADGDARELRPASETRRPLPDDVLANIELRG